MRDQITLTREQLYALVWQKPMARLAAEFSITDVGLAKVCARHEIPTPPRGYWAMLEAGRAPSRPALPHTKNASPIHLRLASPEDNVPELKDELAVAIANEKKPESRIVVAERLQAPNALVQEAKEALQGAESDHLGILKKPATCLDLRVSKAQLPRALRIADALLKAFERRGWEVAVRDGGTFVHLEESPIALTIEEGTETVEVPAKKNLGGSYSFHYNRRETVRKPSGELWVAIKEQTPLWNHAQKKNWRGSDTRVLEDRLNDVVVGMLKLAAAVKADQARREREAREEQERQRRRQAALDEQGRLRAALAKEKGKVEQLLDQAVRWRESDNLRLFVEQARERGCLPELRLDGQALVEWSQWALQQADRLDPFAPSPPSILDDAERIEQMCDEFRGRW